MRNGPSHRQGGLRRTLLPWAGLGASVAIAGTAVAQTSIDVPQGPAKPLWEAGIGALAVSSPAYPGARDRVGRLIALPWLIYRGPVLRADGRGIGARLLRTDAVEFDIGLAAALGASSQDVKVREGMPDLGFQFEFGPRVKLTLARPGPASRIRLDFPVRGVFEMRRGVHSRGLAFEPKLSYEDDRFIGGTGLDTSASAVFGNRTLNRYLYGVPAAFAVPGRPAYQASAGLIGTRLQASLYRHVGSDLRLFGFVRLDHTGGSANADSPLHLENRGVSAGLGLAWTLGRSQRLAED